MTMLHRHARTTCSARDHGAPHLPASPWAFARACAFAACRSPNDHAPTTGGSPLRISKGIFMPSASSDGLDVMALTMTLHL